MKWARAGVVAVAACATSCGDNGGGRDSDSASETAATTATPPTTSGTTAEGTTTGAVSITGTSSDPSTSTTDGTGTTGPGPDLGDPCGGPGVPDVSYIWIANSAQGTISKINTETMKEEGRYIVRPDSAGSPSRTSVNLTGDVAVANRSGGFTKVYARVDSCKESNGMPGIQTSVDSNTLPWGVEECVAWYTPFNYISQRPAAWTPGSFNKETCGWENQKVWTSGASDGQFAGIDMLLLNGETGAVEKQLNVPEIVPSYYGMYGAAVDKEGNVWASQLSQGQLLFVDIETLEHKVWPMPAPGYGMTVGSSGFVWTCSNNASRFDPLTETWQTLSVGGSGGCMEDDNGTLYMSGGQNNIVAIDVMTLAVKATYPLPQYVHGISIDYYGYVWGVSLGSEAYRVDIANPAAFQTFTGLVGAYTYSDMTGVALSNVTPQ